MARLQCRTCGRTHALAAYPQGCPACAGEGRMGLLEVTYAYDGEARRGLEMAYAQRQRHSLWRFDSLLPLAGLEARRVTLGEGGTPLLEADWLRDYAGAESLYLKNETTNPTWCSKDRVNPVNVSMARLLGARGMVATTTGNHGASLAAYSACAGLPAIALCLPLSDVIHRAMIAAYGGAAIVSDNRDALSRHLVRECGWFGATSMGYAEAPNPFGVEGCKTIAYEIYEDLQGVPDVVLLPVASGDLLYGVFKGFRELVALGFASHVPRMVGCQAVGAAPLAAAWRGGLSEVPVLPNPATVAVSVADATSDPTALEALRESGGDVLTVTDDEMLRAQRRLASGGLLVEAASATALAGLAAGVRSGAVLARERVVCVLTGAGVKWSTQLVSAAMGHVLLEPSLATVAALAAQLAERRA